MLLPKYLRRFIKFGFLSTRSVQFVWGCTALTKKSIPVTKLIYGRLKISLRRISHSLKASSTLLSSMKNSIPFLIRQLFLILLGLRLAIVLGVFILISRARLSGPWILSENMKFCSMMATRQISIRVSDTREQFQEQKSTTIISISSSPEFSVPIHMTCPTTCLTSKRAVGTMCTHSPKNSCTKWLGLGSNCWCRGCKMREQHFPVAKCKDLSHRSRHLPSHIEKWKKVDLRDSL